MVSTDEFGKIFWSKGEFIEIRAMSGPEPEPSCGQKGFSGNMQLLVEIPNHFQAESPLFMENL